MKTRALAIPRALSSVAVLALASCREEGPTYTELDLHVGVRLNAVEDNLAYSHFMAVGAEGTVVHYLEHVHPSEYGEVVSWQLGEDELWAVTSVQVKDDYEEQRWFVAGAAGTLYVGIEDERGMHGVSAAERFSWVAQPRIVDADLHGIAATQSDAGVHAFAVGDEVMLSGAPTDERGRYEWTELASPGPNGWGMLRDIAARRNSEGDTELWAVGAQGRVWYSDLGPAGWVAIETGVTDDLVDADGICGHGGMWLTCDRGACTRTHLGTSDFIACGPGWALAADQTLNDPSPPMVELDRLDWLPRAGEGSQWSVLVVGEGGRAGMWRRPQPIHGAL